MTVNTFLVTGASDGIGAVYAERLARRGHGLVLVARRTERLNALAERLRSETGVAIDVVTADLADPAGLQDVESRLAADSAIGGLVNNAGVAGEGTIIGADPSLLTSMIALNVLAVTRLTAALAPRLAAKGEGTIINISSVTALMPDAFSAVYPATKAYVLAFTEAIHAELGPKGVRVQAVLPGVTRTAIWDKDTLASLPTEMVMSVDDMVDAALSGLDLGELVTIPSLPDQSAFDYYVSARQALRPGLSLKQPADRYRA